MASELCVHQLLHIQVVFVQFLLAASTTSPSCLCWLHSFLLCSNQHFALWNLWEGRGIGYGTPAIIALISIFPRGAKHASFVSIGLIKSAHCWAIINVIAIATIRSVHNLATNWLIVCFCVKGWGDVVVLAGRGSCIDNFLILIITKFTGSCLLAVSSVEIEAFSQLVMLIVESGVALLIMEVCLHGLPYWRKSVLPIAVI